MISKYYFPKTGMNFTRAEQIYFIFSSEEKSVSLKSIRFVFVSLFIFLSLYSVPYKFFSQLRSGGFSSSEKTWILVFFENSHFL